MCAKKRIIWKNEPVITEDVFEYSKTFIARFEHTERVFDYSEASLLKEIQYEIDHFEEWDLAEDEARIYWAQVLAYFSATLCSLFDGVCIGEFGKLNKAWSYYTFRVKFKDKLLNVEDVLGRACDKQFDFSKWYFITKSKLEAHSN